MVLRESFICSSFSKDLLNPICEGLSREEKPAINTVLRQLPPVHKCSHHPYTRWHIFRQGRDSLPSEGFPLDREVGECHCTGGT